MNSRLQKEALETGGRLVSKVFTYAELQALPDPSDRNLRLLTEELARRDFKFQGTFSVAHRAPDPLTGELARIVTVIERPDGEGLI